MRKFILALTLTSTALCSAADKFKVLIVDGQNNHKWDITRLTRYVMGCLEAQVLGLRRGREQLQWRALA